MSHFSKGPLIPNLDGDAIFCPKKICLTLQPEGLKNDSISDYQVDFTITKKYETQAGKNRETLRFTG